MSLVEKFPWNNLEIPLIDKKAAEIIANTFHEALFASYLIFASRTGHLFIEIKENTLEPALWDPNLTPLILDGAKSKLSGIIQEGPRYYLERNFNLQNLCKMEWERLKNGKQEPVNIPDIKAPVTEEQKKAIVNGCKSSVFILTGGPGTGKTYTAAKLLQALQNNAKEIALAAPTGKAALTLENAIGGGIKAKTIHSLLGVRKDGSFPEKPVCLPYDVILIDEASMIDAHLMVRLLQSIKTGAKLILMGDPYQLPPVDGPPIFPLLVKEHTEKIELTKCLRAETLDLVHFANGIKQGFFHFESPSITFSSEPLETILQNHLHYFTAKRSIEEHLKAISHFRILTPTKIGKSGSNAINEWIFSRLPENTPIPLMITSNDYRLELFNGEIGILLNDIAYFPSGKSIPVLQLPPHDLAFALTVHKSQGSEFNDVLLLLPETQVSRPLLYTAVTRARQKITLWK